MRGSVEERLVDAVTELAARDGFVALTVDRVVHAAAASRASFYQYFRNVEDGLFAAYRGHAVKLSSHLERVLCRARHPELTALESLVDMARSEPDVARLLMMESLASGPAGLTEREALIARITQLIANSPHSGALDLPVPVLIGGSFRFLAIQMAAGPVSPTAAETLLRWAQCFQLQQGRISVTALLAQRETGKSPGATYGRPPIVHGPSRERFLRATAAAVREVGYREASVAGIAALAGRSRRLFYQHFSHKAAAYVAAYEYGFRQVLAHCTPAFFSSAEWPERVWDTGLAFTRYLASEPLLAHLGFAQCYALGPRYVDRVHETQLAFTWFLEAGHRQPAATNPPSPTWSALTATAVAELGFREVRHGGLRWRALLPLATYIALVPFIGAEAARSFIIGKLRGA